jgi:hypothetical protein
MGKSNTFMGYGAAQYTREGSYNTVFGFNAGQNLAGDENVLIGLVSGQNAISASGNVFIGTNVGLRCTSGSNNALLGAHADVNTYSTANSVAVGYRASAGSANCVAVGHGANSASLNSTCVGAGSKVVGRQSVAIGYRVSVIGDGHFNLADRVRGYVDGKAAYNVQVDADRLKVSGMLSICQPGSNAHAQWTMRLGETLTSNAKPYANLLLHSANDTVVRFTDDFWPGIFDFTAQHRCSVVGGGSLSTSNDELIGCIVVASGTYRDLGGHPEVHMDEAVPEVELCTEARDQRVFGVVSGFEDGANPHREFRLGNLGFSTPRCHADDVRVVVNAAGEGAVWVCDAEGPLRNGDLICSSCVPGMGARQHGDAVLNSTVAKITCDCDFAIRVPGAVLPVEHAGRPYRRVLVGCTYKC